MIKLDYCIIKIAKNKSGSEEVYIYAALPNSTKLDKAVVENKYFQELSSILQENGFSQVEHMMFHISDEKSIKMTSLMKELKTRGFHRNEKLEDIIKGNYNALKRLKEASLKEKEETPFGDKRYPVPKLGQKIDIYFYLFIKTGEKDEDVIDLQLDYDTSYINPDNNYKRFFVKVANSKFTVKKIKGTKIQLESDRSFDDLLSEINLFYQISLIRDERVDMVNMLEPDGAKQIMESIEIYNIMEVFDMLSEKNKIIIHLETDKDYQYLRGISKFLKDEKNKFDEESIIPLILLKESALELINKFTIEIDIFCEGEEYESAALYQKYIDFLKKKIKYIDRLIKQGKENISGKDFQKNFTIKPILSF